MFLHVPLPAVVLMLVASGAGMASPGGQSAPLGPAAGSSTAPARDAAVAQPEAPESKQGGDLPGWRQVFEEEFSAGDVRLGGFPGDPYKNRWSAGYRDGTPDTAGQKKSGGKSGYYPSKVLSVHDGVLDWYLHSDNGVSMGAAPQPKIPNASARPPRHNSLLYGRYSVRFMADPLAGFKIAWLLWPDSGVWPRDGEIDFPEGELDLTIYGAAHAGTDSAEIFDSKMPFGSWHVATTEWSPERIEFFLDGVSLGASTTDVPSKPMHLILQTESCLMGCPAPGTEGHVYLDWIRIWTRA
ncbi:MAG: hypothetical protein QOH19_189 [Actinomycetota bacterium]|jgi:beta-glucanase (GH16 family)|nr:hypothetical protein [Actinomycetota bacterium]